MATGRHPANLPKVDKQPLRGISRLDSRQRQSGVARLGKVIADHVRATRSTFKTDDGIKAGFSEAEMTRFFPDAVIEARRIEPKLDEMAIHQ
jgi:hypothetical protein